MGGRGGEREKKCVVWFWEGVPKKKMFCVLGVEMFWEIREEKNVSFFWFLKISQIKSLLFFKKEKKKKNGLLG